MEGLTLYINPKTLILIPVLYTIGLILDQTPFIPKWAHAWIKLMFAVISCLLYFGLDIRSVVQGILVTGVEMVFRDTTQNTIFGIYEKAKQNESNQEITIDNSSKGE
jgi:hypothetical protein